VSAHFSGESSPLSVSQRTQQKREIAIFSV